MFPDSRNRKLRTCRPLVDAAGGAGFGDGDLGEEGEGRLEVGPDPGGEGFAGGVLEAGDVVETVVVEQIVERAEGGLDVGVVHHPAEVGIDGSFDDDFDDEGMAVESAALVSDRNPWETVGGFDL